MQVAWEVNLRYLHAIDDRDGAWEGLNAYHTAVVHKAAMWRQNGVSGQQYLVLVVLGTHGVV